MIEISKRLHTIANQIPVGATVADIGSDHALLPTYLVQSGRSSYVVAGEVNEGPYQSAVKQIVEIGFQDKVKVRKGNGLSVIENGEVEVVVIAGMGGSLITQILMEGIDKLREIKRLVLQPNVGEEFVRKFGIEYNWELVHEEMIEEDGRIYEILTFKKGNGDLPYTNQNIPQNLLVKLGPFFVKEKKDLFYKKWKRELIQLENVIFELTKSKNPQTLEKRKRLQYEIDQLKEVIY